MTNYRILLVEDNPNWQLILQSKIGLIFRKMNKSHFVHLAKTFDDAWSSVTMNGPWHLLVTDIGLGKVGENTKKLGLHLIEHAQYLGIACLVVSGTPILTPSDVLNVIKRIGEDRFFWKADFKSESFIECVTNILSDLEQNLSHNQALAIAEVINPVPFEMWWQGILTNSRRYDCYSFFLTLPSDSEANRYLSDYGSELQAILGESYLMAAFGTDRCWLSGYENAISVFTTTSDSLKSPSVEIAKLIGVEFSAFPCLVIFQDIKSTEYVVIPFKGKSAEEIADDLRSLFSIIQKTTQSGKSLIPALKNHAGKERFRSIGSMIISNLPNIAGKTFETAIGTLLKTVIQ